MAYIDEIAISEIEVQLAGESKDAFTGLAKRLLWELFEKHKHESYKGKLWGMFPYSIKVAKIEPIFERFLGPNPYA